MSIAAFIAKYEARLGKPGCRDLGLLCNQTSFDFDRRAYLFAILASRGCLKRLFLPEHGLFAELQDQIPLTSGSIYEEIASTTEIVSLYGEEESSLVSRADHLRDLDALVVDIQDVGSRYYTFATTLSYIYDLCAEENIALKLIVLDRPNPAGRLVEGTCLPESFASFVGRPGLLHRHGLTMGELCHFYQHQTQSPIELEVIAPAESTGWMEKGALVPQFTWEIPPSPNMPSPITARVYSGQCLLEGTNLNEGRGTTRPFEVFGAPYLDWIHRATRFPEATGAYLRPLRYIPTFHKHGGELCSGFQIHLTPGEGDYHSLAHTLKILRWIKENSVDFAWHEGVYEYRSDRPAIEILVGDDDLQAFLNGETPFSSVREKMQSAEREWCDFARRFCLYPALPRAATLDSRHDFF